MQVALLLDYYINLKGQRNQVVIFPSQEYQ